MYTSDYPEYLEDPGFHPLAELVFFLYSHNIATVYASIHIILLAGLSSSLLACIYRG